MLEAMIDIETLDTGPRSVILSIGAVKFDRIGPLKTPTFFRALELDQQMINFGRTVSQATLFWWHEQSDVAWHTSLHPNNRVMPYSAMSELRAFLRGVECFWANPPAFDCTILDGLYRDIHLEIPWKHNQLRDMRTLREEAGMPRDWSPEGWLGVAHDPVDDCRFQIEVVREARRRIKSCL